jgi:type I site-specific restriction endonuclease
LREQDGCHCLPACGLTPLAFKVAAILSTNDGALGDQYLKEFQDNEKTIPTILTTSQKLSTGVDARNVRNIVLLRPIKSMIEFKQIIGRGTDMELQAIESKRGTQDAFLRFAELHFIDIARAWEVARAEQRRRVQSLLFKDGLHYSQEQGLLNRSNSSLFSLLAMTSDENDLLASPTGFEPRVYTMSVESSWATRRRGL